jgi:hypothetical protein
MSPKRGTPDKEEWLREAEAAHQRAFGERDGLGEGAKAMTFSEIEAGAVREGHRLACWLLERMIPGESAGCCFQERKLEPL